MPLNERKIVKIILEKCNEIEERCPGYREELEEVVADIVFAEREHRIKGTYIQKHISERCDTAGRFLLERGKKEEERE